MKHVLAVSSGGGHWHQLNLVSSGFAQHRSSWLTTIRNTEADHRANTHQIKDADSTQPLSLLRMAVQVFYCVLKTRPDVVVSTGAAIGFFAVAFGRLVGAHTIWIDSIANYHQLSLSGKYARLVCHLHLSQWPDLGDGNPTQYWGSVF